MSGRTSWASAVAIGGLALLIGAGSGWAADQPGATGQTDPTKAGGETYQTDPQSPQPTADPTRTSEQIQKDAGAATSEQHKERTGADPTGAQGQTDPIRTGGEKAADQMGMAAGYTGMHTMEGEVTHVDSRAGKLSLKTKDAGTLELHFPPTALQNVKQGDRISVQLALKPAGDGTTRTRPQSLDPTRRMPDDQAQQGGASPQTRPAVGPQSDQPQKQ
jgi:hypothetical protein